MKDSLHHMMLPKKSIHGCTRDEISPLRHQNEAKYQSDAYSKYLTYSSLIQSGGPLYTPNPKKSSPSSFMSLKTNSDIFCDCEAYQSYNMACPCSVIHAARVGRKMTERVLARSSFFDGALEISDNEERKTKRPQVLEIDPCNLEITDFLGNGGYCEVHAAQVLHPSSDSKIPRRASQAFPCLEQQFMTSVSSSSDSPTASTTADLDSVQATAITSAATSLEMSTDSNFLINNKSSSDSEQTPPSATFDNRIMEFDTDTTTTASSSSSEHSDVLLLTSRQEVMDKRRKETLLKTCFPKDHKFCMKFLKPSVLANKKKFARGIADLCIEAHFLGVLSHPHIVRLHAVTEGFGLFQPNSINFLQNITYYSGREGCCFLLLDQLETTLEHTIIPGNGGSSRPGTADSRNSAHSADSVGGERYAESYKLNKGLSRLFNGSRGQKRRALRVKSITTAIQIAEVMLYLHEHNIIYRDLKPDNIGFDKYGAVKIFDFGLVKELKDHERYEDGTYQLTKNTGSRRYMAPEVAKRLRYNLSADVYSFGILLWEICTMRKSFEGYDHKLHVELVIDGGERPNLDLVTKKSFSNRGARGQWPKEMSALIEKCWPDNLHNRINFVDIIKELRSIFRIVTKGIDYVSLQLGYDNENNG